MHRFQFFREKAGNVDAGTSEKMQLPEKLPEGAAPLMVHECLRNQAAFKTLTNDADAVLNVLAHAGDEEAARFLVHIPRQAHVERTRMELPAQRLFFAPDATRRKRRGHGVADGFLDGVEVGAGRIGAAVQVVTVTVQVGFHGLQVVRRNNAVGIENDEIIAAGAFKAEVAGKALAAVFLAEIPDIQLIGE